MPPWQNLQLLRQLDADVLVESRTQYEACKRRFANGYARYVQLDRELAEHTSNFDAMHAEFEASEGAKAEAAAERIAASWVECGDDMREKLYQYRALHVELRQLKEATNRFVRDASEVEARLAAAHSRGQLLDR